MNYMADISMGSVTFGKILGERAAGGIGVQYSNYGKMQEYTADNTLVGDLSANDLCANIFYARDLTDHLRGGITGKFFYSNYAHNTAIGLGVDLGLSYYRSDQGLSIGLVAKNVGRQLKAYEEELAPLPWDIQLGFSKRMEHAPIRYSITAAHLKQWKFDPVTGEKDPFLKTAFKHLIFGVDFLPSDNFWIGVGYNVRRGADMDLVEGNKFGGFSAGAGVKVKSIAFSCSIGQYNLSATSVMFSVATSLLRHPL
jgi:hypothetical protein